jgi:hypothetical protein
MCHPAKKAEVILARSKGMSQREIAEQTGVCRSSIVGILGEADVDQQLEKARIGAIGLYPKALRAVETDLESGNGTLGIRLLEGIGAIGENAVRQERGTSRTGHAINVLVQAGANVAIGSTSASERQAIGGEAQKLDAGTSKPNVINAVQQNT